MQPRHLVLALLVAGAALLSWWLSEPPAETAERSARPDGPREVAYRVRGFEVVRMTPAGIPAHRLTAETLWHFIDDDTTELDTPHLTVFQNDEPPWEIDAERAWVSSDGSLVLLSGEVIIDRAAGARSPPTTIVTRDLRVQPDQDYAETDEPVRVETDSDWLTAVGMRAWLRPPSRITFLSDVEGFYVPR
ncbi:MAG: LPS export ABC transporter periplasmic protein LptC [Chromatiaceae bacterium]|jgi:lipopolysaccharide export system protein LptC